MSTTTIHPFRDSATMMRREFKHTSRNPETLFGALVVPVILLLLFNYFFGGAMNVGTRYLDYMVPGIIMLTAGYGVGVTAVGMATDVAEGVVNRFRTMAISRASVPTGHVVGSLVTTLAGIVVVLGVTVVMGFRPNATPVEWLAAIGVIVLLVLAISGSQSPSRSRRRTPRPPTSTLFRSCSSRSSALRSRRRAR